MTSPFPLDDAQLSELQVLAADLARGGGELLSGYFGRSIDVEFKDEKQTDPVTVADRESQRFLEEGISGRFPDHGIVGEEDEETGEDTTTPDIVWLLDPLDGTKNFVAGLPVYGCSVGVLFRGIPVAGAIYLPWPGEGGGVVVHARRGGGAFLDDRPISVDGGEGTGESRLIGLPAGFGQSRRFKGMGDGPAGEPRVTGSITYELALTAAGVLRYSLIRAPKLWDVAAGAILVTEAGGVVMLHHQSRRLRALEKTWWEPLDSFVSPSESGGTTVGQLRRRSSTMVFGSREAVEKITAGFSQTRLARPRLGGGRGP